MCFLCIDALQELISDYRSYGDGGNTAIEAFRKRLSNLSKDDRHHCYDELVSAVDQRSVAWQHALQVLTDDRACTHLQRLEEKASMSVDYSWADRVVLSLLQTQSVSMPKMIFDYIESGIRANRDVYMLAAASPLVDIEKGLDLGVAYLLNADESQLRNYGIVSAFVGYSAETGKDHLVRLLVLLSRHSPSRAKLFATTVVSVLSKPWAIHDFGENFVLSVTKKISTFEFLLP